MRTLPSLDVIEAGAYRDDSNARFSISRFRDNREPSTKGDALGSFDCCWCGEPHGHPWPGKSEGKPHPRGRLV
jgi:hypothetical protein